MSNLYFSFGSTWRTEDVRWLVNFFRAHTMTPDNLALVGFALGRRPDSILIKLQREGMAKCHCDCRYETCAPLASASIDDDWVAYFKATQPEEVLKKFPTRMEHAAVLHYYKHQTAWPGTAPCEKQCRPDDRILYLSKDEAGKCLAASFDWQEIAERGVSEKCVVDMNSMAKALWYKLSPFDQAILKAAIKEGKV